MTEPNKQHLKPWQRYLLIAVQSILAIYVATFCVGLFYLHHGEHWLTPAIILGVLYVTVVIFSIRHLIKNLPMAVLMIAAPTVPLIILLLVVALLPILQLF